MLVNESATKVGKKTATVFLPQNNRSGQMRCLWDENRGLLHFLFVVFVAAFACVLPTVTANQGQSKGRDEAKGRDGAPLVRTTLIFYVAAFSLFVTFRLGLCLKVMWLSLPQHLSAAS